MPRVNLTMKDKRRAECDCAYGAADRVMINYIYNTLRERHMSQQALADEAGVSLSSVKKLLQDPGGLQFSIVRQILDVLDIEVRAGNKKYRHSTLLDQAERQQAAMR